MKNFEQTMLLIGSVLINNESEFLDIVLSIVKAEDQSEDIQNVVDCIPLESFEYIFTCQEFLSYIRYYPDFAKDFMERNKQYTRNDILKIHENTSKYGGSFAKAMGEALLKADIENEKLLVSNFKDLFNRYLKM